MNIKEAFSGMRPGPRLIQHPIDEAETATKPFAELGPFERSGAGTRCRIKIGFRETGTLRPFEGIYLKDDGRTLEFGVVGGWELDELGEVLIRLGQSLSDAAAKQATKH